MEFFIRRFPPHRDCRAAEERHITAILASSRPEIEDTARNKFREESRLDKEGELYFSPTRLESHFKDRRIVEWLLRCQCGDCKVLTDDRSEESENNDRSEDSDVDDGYSLTELSRINRAIEHHWLEVAIFTYLGKLHIFRAWNASADGEGMQIGTFLGSPGGQYEHLLTRNGLDKYLPGAYLEASRMFRPVIFEVPTDNQNNSLVVFNEYSKNARFPFIYDGGQQAKQRKNSRVESFFLSEEFVTQSVKARLHGYQAPIDGKHHFARKVFRSEKSKAKQIRQIMESDVIRLLDSAARLKTEVREQIIVLIAAYSVKDEYHPRAEYCLVFPFVEGDLEQLLQGKWHPDNAAKDPEKDETLLDFWLWKEFEGICEALATLHYDIKHPLNPDHHVAFFHFDLKPANILITLEGKLKITDFGQSYIMSVAEGKEPTSALNGGDLIYCAPEAGDSPMDTTRGTKDYFGSSETSDEETRVRLNYDVWSLACIMTEIMTFWLGRSRCASGEEAVMKLRTNRFNENLRVPFYKSIGEKGEKGEQRVLKDCINNQLAEILKHTQLPEPPEGSGALEVSGALEAFGDYLDASVTLARRMFEIDPAERIFSKQVVSQLKAARATYQTDVDGHDGDLTKYVRRCIPANDPDELGFQISKTAPVVSFSKINDVDYAFDPGKTSSTPSIECSPCKFRLFMDEKRCRSQDLFQICFGYRPAGGEKDRDTIDLPAHESFLIPVHLVGDRYKLSVIPPKSRSGGYKVHTFGFSTEDDAIRLQSALLRHRMDRDEDGNHTTFVKKVEISWGAQKSSSILKSFKSLKSSTEGPKLFGEDLKLQFWGPESPVYVSYENQPRNPVDTYSQQETKKQTQSDLILFGEAMQYLVVPGNSEISPKSRVQFRKKAYGTANIRSRHENNWKNIRVHRADARIVAEELKKAKHNFAQVVPIGLRPFKAAESAENTKKGSSSKDTADQSEICPELLTQIEIEFGAESDLQRFKRKTEYWWNK